MNIVLDSRYRLYADISTLEEANLLFEKACQDYPHGFIVLYNKSGWALWTRTRDGKFYND